MTERARFGAAGALGLFAAVSLWACSVGSASPPAPAASNEVSAAASAKARTYVSNTANAIGLTFDSRGRLIYAEKDSGRIIRAARGKRTTLARLRIAGGGEAGLLGLASGPGDKVWAHYTTSNANCPNPTSGSSSGAVNAHCVWRLRPSGGKLKADKLIFSSGHPSTATNHVGGGLHFGPDGALYLGLGDLGENGDPNKGPGRAQDLSVPFGKILRLNPNATNRGASGNPTSCGNASNTAKREIEDGRIWACGLRNPFSFDWDRQGRMWAADVGDACDEINIVRAGVNYGWEPPRTDCAGKGKGRPVIKRSGTPSGVAIPKSAKAGAWRGDVFYGVFADSSLVRYDLGSKGQSRISGANGRTGWALVATDRYLYMSNGSKISRLKLPGA